MTAPGPNINGEVPTVLVKDKNGRDLLCFLEQLIPLDDKDYALLTPVDTPVSLFRLIEGNDPELIETIASSEPILSVADVVLQEHDLTLIRSAVTLTVNGELDEPDLEELEEEETNDESETFELLVSFMVQEQEYGLYIPLDPFFVVACMIDGQAKLVEGEEFDRIQPLIEVELEDREL
ncbi:MAG: DUF3727 domain-containing protein [Prochlorococcus sp.]|jgi:hypothetical protein|nr:DUF3727 domain-containing protein [Prochlorococcaceae cyanobacterium ETNP18_MAG_14]MDP6309493.1 DUF3727 domain-containing protein [Prochlorococcaceae cyanobacterium ETNP14_MAG_4]HJM81081.1 DUF3727 domain-containing protein [Prochlorococcaceae cyanobacterium Fu_MAG_72]|tara:strand:- start:3912 stop:4448 length:537 start_codon:yes stop_codon:yes gene_type:complete